MKHITRVLLTLFALCLVLTACARIEPSDVIDETTGGAEENPLWPYTPSDDEPLIGNVLIPGERELLYYDGGVYVYGTLGDLFGNGPYDGRKNMVTTLRRIDMATGEVTFVCPDPLCDHKLATCPFNGIMRGGICRFFIDADGNIIYYRNISTGTGTPDEKQYHVQLCTYNLNTKKWKIHYDEITDDSNDTFSSRILIYNGNLYYYKAEYQEQENGKTQILWHFVRQNIETSKIEVLSEPKKQSELSADNIYNIAFGANDRIYFQSPTKICSTGLDLTDKQTVYSGNYNIRSVYTNGQHIFFSLVENLSSDEEQIYRMDLDGSHLTKLEIATDYTWTVTQNYIYFTRPMPEILIPDLGGGGAFSTSSDAVMRCDHNGENLAEIFVYNHPGEDEIPHYRVIAEMLPVGNYVYTREHGTRDENLDGMTENSERYHYNARSLKPDLRGVPRIDTITGEVTYVNLFET